MHPCIVSKEDIHLNALNGVVGNNIALYWVLLCYQIGPDASCTPSSLHPYTLILVAIYPDGSSTLIISMNACATARLGPVLVPTAQPHQRVKACGSTMGAYMCPRVQACQCSLCVVFAFVY